VSYLKFDNSPTYWGWLFLQCTVGYTDLTFRVSKGRVRNLVSALELVM